MTTTATDMGPFRSAPSSRTTSPAPLTLRLETSLDWLGKSLRINRETQTGDAAFDKRIYLESDASDAVVLAVLGDATLRANVVKCLELGGASVMLDRGGNLRVERSLPHAKLVQAALLTPLIDALGASADAIPPLVAARAVRTFGGRLSLACVVSAVLSVPLLFLSNALWEPLGSDLYGSATLAGFVLWFISLPILVVVLRGRAVALRELGTCAIALAFALPLGGTDLLLTLNGLFDTSAPIIHETRVSHLRKTSGKHTTYYVTFGSWRPGETTIEIPITSSLFYKLSQGTGMSVTTARGFLGWERLLHLAPTATPRTAN